MKKQTDDNAPGVCEGQGEGLYPGRPGGSSEGDLHSAGHGQEGRSRQMEEHVQRA